MHRNRGLLHLRGLCLGTPSAPIVLLGSLGDVVVVIPHVHETGEQVERVAGRAAERSFAAETEEMLHIHAL